MITYLALAAWSPTMDKNNDFFAKGFSKEYEKPISQYCLVDKGRIEMNQVDIGCAQLKDEFPVVLEQTV